MEQRELLFNEEGKSFVSETKVNSDYNLHIEMESGGTLEIYQREVMKESIGVHILN